jgi:hypothetical protein
MRTIPCLKVRTDSFAVAGAAVSVNERRKTAQNGMAP